VQGDKGAWYAWRPREVMGFADIEAKTVRDLKRKITRDKRNSTEVFNHGYVAGYNQHRVDVGEMTQAEADKVIKNWNTTDAQKKWIKKCLKLLVFGQ